MYRHLATLDFNLVAVVHDPTLVWHHFCDATEDSGYHWRII